VVSESFGLMRILHLDTGRQLRGGQRQLLLLARGLAQRGHEQSILAQHGGALYEASRVAGFETLPCTVMNLVRQARKADLIHAHDARAHTLAALAGGGVPLIVSRRVAFPVQESVFSRWKYRRATRFLAVSECARARLVEAGLAAGRIAVVYDGVDLKNRPHPAQREPFVLAPETSDPEKGSALAVEACRAAGIALRFSGRLEDDLPRASAFLYLSHSEGLGSAILLAMACHTPVIASRVGGIPEIVDHGKTGLLVCNTPDAVADAIQTVFADPAAAAQLARAAWEQLASRFSDHIMVERTEQEYGIALEGRTGTQAAGSQLASHHLPDPAVKH
jgi:glycosyltransferase involved in cell wall biosynthesis